MGRKFKKAAAALLVAAMFLQQCNVVSFAESDPTEMSADAQAAAEAQAQAEAEAAAQAAAEAQAQAEAEAAAQAAAEAEAAAQAAAEAQAQAEAEAAQAAAEAQAQAEAEAAAAQAAAEAQAQAEAEAAAQAAAEAEAAAQAEAEAQAAAEAETEQQARSARVNAGMEIRRDDLTTMLENVLPYLFVAETLVFPETQEEEAQEPDEEESLPIPEDWVMEGDPAYTELTDQVWNSLALADAQSTEEVTVINLYADEVGILDTTQLYNIYEDQILDVTDNRYYVVNVIADSPDQVLDFSGFDLSENGFYLYYTESTQPCSVLYNFAAMDGEEYTYYKGTLRLWGDLQGTVLAPAATVEVEQNLAGAVYARNISVISPEAQLQRNIYIEGEPEVLEPETEAAVTEAPAPETEEPAPETEAVTEAPALETEAPAPEMEAAEPEIIEAPAPETEAPAPETEAVTEEPETEIVTESPETEPETEIVTEAPETETETETEVVTEAPETETETEEPEAIKTLEAGEPRLLYEDGNQTLTVTAKVYYEKEEDGNLLTAAQEVSYKVTLFFINGEEEEEAATGTLTFTKGESSAEVTLKELSAGKYRLKVYESSQIVDDKESNNEFLTKDIEIKDNNVNANDTLALVYEEYPTGIFGYVPKISVTLDMKNRKDSKLKTKDTFYVMVYDSSGEEVHKSLEEIKLDEESSQKIEIELPSITAKSETYYIVERADSKGSTIDEYNFAYTPTYKSTKGEEEKEHIYGEIEVKCGEDASETITNKLNDTVVKLNIKNKSGDLINGSFVVLDDTATRITDESTKEEEFKNTKDGSSVLKDEKTYYLYQVNAPEGYVPGSFEEFTVQTGLTQEITIVDEKESGSAYRITVTKEEYANDYPLYVYNTTDTFYVALFSNKGHTKKVSDVQKIQISNASTGSVTFSAYNLDSNKDYYIAETDKWGIVKESTDECRIEYSVTNGNIYTSSNSLSMNIRNVYSSRPDSDHRYYGFLTIRKNVVDSSGNAFNTTGLFYVGIFSDANYSGLVQIIPFSFQNESSQTSSRRRILFTGENDVTYYIAEVDENGKLITSDSDFAFEPSVDYPQITITKGGDETVTVTNKEKEDNSYRVTLRLEKHVFDGDELLPVNETFYIGLFKDEALTTLWTNPVKMELQGKSGLTYDLTLNITGTSPAAVYVAEVDSSGRLITDYEAFGYDIEVANSKAEFSTSNLSAHTVVGNFVYGTTTAEERAELMGDFYDDDEDYTLDENGEFDDGDGEYKDEESVKTADNTPVAGTMALMAAALIVLGFSIRRRRRAS